MMRLAGKIAVVVGAGQSPGAGIGNARATVLRFAQEGPKILAVDGDLILADETAVRPRSLVANAAPSLLRTSVAAPVPIFGAWAFAENGLLCVPDGPLRARWGW
jgi:NAD(P)-dependent dehydrogenase (short-subunit alcohol dehydrogenase family)